MERISPLRSTSELLARNVELEEALGDGDGGNFISGWQCINPCKASISQGIVDLRGTIGDNEYLYADRFSSLEKSFSEFHTKVDARIPERVIFGSGSTALLLLAAAWIAELGFREVFYVTPMYFTLHSVFKILGVRARPVNALHPYEQEFSLNLPPEGGVLILTDPIWYSGTRVPSLAIEQIREWQLLTRSFVVVDGSFQYMAWSHADTETTSSLDPSLTLRVICPTKQLAMHGYRASYMLAPSDQYREILTLNSHLFGSLSVDTIAFFLAARETLFEQNYRQHLMNLAALRHRILREHGVIAAPWDPGEGYFCFERITISLKENTLLMDGSYFGQNRYPEYVRINLLSPQLNLLCQNVDVGMCIEFDKLSSRPP